MPNVHPKYDRQVIIGLIDHQRKPEQQTYWKLNQIWQQKGYDPRLSNILVIEKNHRGLHFDKRRWLSFLSEITNQSRIYITGHCTQGASDLFGYIKYSGIYEEYCIPAETLAGLILFGLKHANAEQLCLAFANEHTRKLQISLLGCYAGLGSADNRGNNMIGNLTLVNDSFAANLLGHLYNGNLNCDITARLGKTKISSTDDLYNANSG